MPYSKISVKQYELFFGSEGEAAWRGVATRGVARRGVRRGVAWRLGGDMAKGRGYVLRRTSSSSGEGRGGTCLFNAKCMTSVPVMFMFTEAAAFPSVVGFSR